jgi:hypothetical protein
LRIGRNVAIEILQSQEVLAGLIRKRAHSIHADAGDVLQASRVAQGHMIAHRRFILF